MGDDVEREDNRRWGSGVLRGGRGPDESLVCDNNSGPAVQDIQPFGEDCD